MMAPVRLSLVLLMGIFLSSIDHSISFAEASSKSCSSSSVYSSTKTSSNASIRRSSTNNHNNTKKGVVGLEKRRSLALVPTKLRSSYLSVQRGNNLVVGSSGGWNARSSRQFLSCDAFHPALSSTTQHGNGKRRGTSTSNRNAVSVLTNNSIQFNPKPHQHTHISTTNSISKSSALFAQPIQRGGANNDDDDTIVDQKPKSKLKMTISILLTTILATLIVQNKQAIQSFQFKEHLSTQLDNLSNLGTPGLIIYTILFALWEITAGITTPVETAAGMAFGIRRGIIANAIGKTTGALTAFCLGRTVLQSYVLKKLDGNEYMELVQHSIRKHPIRVALIWRFSFLPEFVKNFGLAVLPVKWWQFGAAVVMHGFPFTVLWTFMGNEMGAVVRGVAEPSKILKLMVTGVYIFGFFISPSLVGLWIKGLRDEQKERALKKEK